MGISCGIEDNSFVFSIYLLDFIDQFPFDIRLKIRQFDIFVFFLKCLKKVVKCFCGVNIVFPPPEQVEIGAVDDDYFHSIKIENITCYKTERALKILE